MSDDDLIRRGDAVLAVTAADKECLGANGAREFIRSLPAVQVSVKPLVWDDFVGRGAKAQAWNQAHYMIQKWSDGRWEISASYPGYSNCVDGIARFHPTLKAAKAAAQADYEARIRSALTAQPSPDVAALVEAADKLLDAYSAIVGAGNPWGDELRAALARVKGGEA